MLHNLKQGHCLTHALCSCTQIRSQKEKARPQAAEKGTECIEHNGFRVWKLAEPRIIRRPIGPPNKADGSFYYNLLLSEVPFRDEAVITPAADDFFLQCVRQKVFTTQEQLDGFIQHYADYNLWDVTRLTELRDKVRSSLEVHQEMLGVPDAANADTAALRADLAAGVDAMETAIQLELEEGLAEAAAAQEAEEGEPATDAEEGQEAEGQAATEEAAAGQHKQLMRTLTPCSAWRSCWPRAT
jgi:hypothetical protein